MKKYDDFIELINFQQIQPATHELKNIFKLHSFLNIILFLKERVIELRFKIENN